MAKWGGDRSLEVLTLELQGEIFALEAACVREILDPPPITEVPGAQPFVPGLHQRPRQGRADADLRVRFGMELTPATVDTRVIVIDVDIDGQLTTVGIRATRSTRSPKSPRPRWRRRPASACAGRPEFISLHRKRGANHHRARQSSARFRRPRRRASRRRRPERAHG